MVITARWKHAINVMEDAEPVRTKLRLQPHENVGGGVCTLVVNGDDFVEILNMASNGQFKKVLTISYAHKSADARLSLSNPEIRSLEPIASDFHVLIFETAG